MRWTAERFWREREGIAPTKLVTANDALREAFLVGASEAEVQHGVPVPGDLTLYVAGLGRRQRRALEKTMRENSPVNRRVRVKKLKGRDNA